MREAACNSFGAALRDEWSVISSGRWARARLRRWVEEEPVLGDFMSLGEVVEAIAVPVGHSAELSVEVTRAVLRLAVEDPLASRLLLQVMVPIMAKECFRSLRILQSQAIAVDDAELVTLVLGSAADAIASLAGLHRVYPLRVLRQRTLKRVERRRDQLIAHARELSSEDRMVHVAAPEPSVPPAVLLARTLRVAVGKGIVSAQDASLVWASVHRGETSLSLAAGDAREAERLRRRRSRAQRRLAQHRSDLVEAIAI